MQNFEKSLVTWGWS